MNLSKQQQQQILSACLKAQQNNSLIATSKKQIQQHAKMKRETYLRNKKVIDEVFYHEMACA